MCASGRRGPAALTRGRRTGPLRPLTSTPTWPRTTTNRVPAATRRNRFRPGSGRPGPVRLHAAGLRVLRARHGHDRRRVPRDRRVHGDRRLLDERAGLGRRDRARQHRPPAVDGLPDVDRPPPRPRHVRRDADAQVGRGRRPEQADQILAAHTGEPRDLHLGLGRARSCRWTRAHVSARSSTTIDGRRTTPTHAHDERRRLDPRLRRHAHEHAPLLPGPARRVQHERLAARTRSSTPRRPSSGAPTSTSSSATSPTTGRSRRRTPRAGRSRGSGPTTACSTRSTSTTAPRCSRSSRRTLLETQIELYENYGKARRSPTRRKRHGAGQADRPAHLGRRELLPVRGHLVRDGLQDGRLPHRGTRRRTPRRDRHHARLPRLSDGDARRAARPELRPGEARRDPVDEGLVRLRSALVFGTLERPRGRPRRVLHEPDVLRRRHQSREPHSRRPWTRPRSSWTRPTAR